MGARWEYTSQAGLAPGEAGALADRTRSAFGLESHLDRRFQVDATFRGRPPLPSLPVGLLQTGTFDISAHLPRKGDVRATIREALSRTTAPPEWQHTFSLWYRWPTYLSDDLRSRDECVRLRSELGVLAVGYRASLGGARRHAHGPLMERAIAASGLPIRYTGDERGFRLELTGPGSLKTENHNADVPHDVNPTSFVYEPPEATVETLVDYAMPMIALRGEDRLREYGWYAGMLRDPEDRIITDPWCYPLGPSFYEEVRQRAFPCTRWMVEVMTAVSGPQEIEALQRLCGPRDTFRVPIGSTELPDGRGWVNYWIVASAAGYRLLLEANTALDVAELERQMGMPFRLTRET